MNDLFFTTGQAAKELDVPQSRIRALCSARAIACEVTAGGQFRIPTAEVARLKRDGVPAIPRPLPDADRVSAKRSTSGLLGDPSRDVIASAESVVKLENDVRSIGLLKEKEEGLDWFRERKARQQKAQAQRDQAESEREAAEERERGRRLWESKWIHHAFALIPADAPATSKLDVDACVREALSRLDIDTSEDHVEQLVDAAVAKALESWLLANRRESVAKETVDRAKPPFLDDAAARRLYSTARAAIEKLPATASLQDMGAIAAGSIKRPLEEIAHQERCQETVDRVWCQISAATSQETDEAKERVTAALARLPVGVSRRQIDEARDAALEPTRKAIARREQLRVRTEMIHHAEIGLGIPWGLSSNLKEQVVDELKEKLESLSATSTKADLEKARDQIVKWFENFKHLIDGGIAVVGPFLAKAKQSWDLDHVSQSSLESEVRADLEEMLDGTESAAGVAQRVKELVRDHLGIDD